MQVNQEKSSTIKLTTNADVRTLEPKVLWNHFADLNAVPRPSKKEQQVIQFMKDFGAKLELNTNEDETGNIIIKKPATKGMENRKSIVIQSHLDMVHQKNNDTIFDFETQGIQMHVDGDWVKAKGTTLGADNGIGVATIMALLSSEDIAHPAIEALFTVDEETGMTGALNLRKGALTSDILLNLDTEDDRELTIGCAGGIDITAMGKYMQERTPLEMKGYKLTVKGLTGGHSGMDINKGRANANKIMSQLIEKTAEKVYLRVASIDGGSLRNAIPRESISVILVNENEEKNLKAFIEEVSIEFRKAFSSTDPNLSILLEEHELPGNVMEESIQRKLIKSLNDSHNGVYSMSAQIEGLVQTSNNLARVLVKNGEYAVMCLTRSSVDSDKMELAEKIGNTFSELGGIVDFSGEYPGWTPKTESNIVRIMHSLYREMFNEEPLVNACHAGLECGIIGAHYPEMEMISFGPNITGAHSPDESVQISSVQKYWEFLIETLKKIPLQ